MGGSIGQKFIYEPGQNGGLIKLEADPRYCVVIDGNQGQDGASIQLWTCDSSVDAQRWFEVGKIQFQNASNRKCIVVKDNQGYNGNNVELRSCEGDAEYKWWAIVTSSRELEAPKPHNLTLQSASFGGAQVDRQPMESNFAVSSTSDAGALIEWGADQTLCLSVKDNTFFDGQNIWLWSCQVSVSAARGLLLGSIGQKFIYEPGYNGGLIKLEADPRYCVVIDGNQGQDGANIQLWTCDSSVDAQRWFEIGKIQFQNAANKKCIVVKENQGYNGNKVELGACEGDAEYKWWAIVTSSLELEAPKPQNISLQSASSIGSQVDKQSNESSFALSSTSDAGALIEWGADPT